jgi:hypothetical protein
MDGGFSMRALPLAFGALLATAGAASAQTVEIEDAVAKVTVITEARSDVRSRCSRARGPAARPGHPRGDKASSTGA